jgi:hypothetical protein
VAESPTIAQLVSMIVTEALGEERARELHARGAEMDSDHHPVIVRGSCGREIAVPGISGRLGLPWRSLDYWAAQLHEAG